MIIAINIKSISDIEKIIYSKKYINIEINNSLIISNK